MLSAMKITPGISSIVLGRTNLFRLTIIVSQRLIDCAFEPKILAWRNDLDSGRVLRRQWQGRAVQFSRWNKPDRAKRVLLRLDERRKSLAV
jgi:hypothetical protein